MHFNAIEAADGTGEELAIDAEDNATGSEFEDCTTLVLDVL